MKHAGFQRLTWAFFAATLLLVACGDSVETEGGGGAETHACRYARDCVSGEACVDYVTDMSTGTQCRSLGGCADCACATDALCENSDAMCDELPSGAIHLSNCFFGP